MFLKACASLLLIVLISLNGAAMGASIDDSVDKMRRDLEKEGFAEVAIEMIVLLEKGNLSDYGKLTIFQALYGSTYLTGEKERIKQALIPIVRLQGKVPDEEVRPAVLMLSAFEKKYSGIGGVPEFDSQSISSQECGEVKLVGKKLMALARNKSISKYERYTANKALWGIVNQKGSKDLADKMLKRLVLMSRVAPENENRLVKVYAQVSGKMKSPDKPSLFLRSCKNVLNFSKDKYAS